MVDRASFILFLRYLMVGAGSVIIYVSCAFVLHRMLFLQPMLANAAGYLVATLSNYLLNYYWAFTSSRSHTEAAWRFIVVVVVGVFLNSAYAILLLRMTDLPVEVVALSFAILWPLISFASLRFWALR